MRISIAIHDYLGTIPFLGRGLVASVQRTRNRFSNIAADERFAEHVDNPRGLRAFAQLRSAVATHEND
jgi:hypothetical protein